MQGRLPAGGGDSPYAAFERSHAPAMLPRFLPNDWKGGFVLLLLVFVLATKLMMSGVRLSASVLGLLTAIQLPHVVIFACGLGTYWLIDEWVGNETWALISTTGVSRRRLAAAVLAPGMVIALWMLVFNVTAFRKAIADAGPAGCEGRKVRQHS